MSQALLDDAPISINIALQGEPGTFNAADMIVIQARFGGLRGRHFDESFSIDQHICGDEGLGPGGFSAAWRGWPELAAVLNTVTHEAPAAKVVLLSAPLALYYRCARAYAPSLDIVGLCDCLGRRCAIWRQDAR